MNVEFADEQLDRLETDPRHSAGHGQSVDRGFRKAMQAIRAAADERDLFQSRGLGFEKLKGNRKHQHSLKINDQWRLVIELQGKSQDKVARIIAIEDYH